LWVLVGCTGCNPFACYQRRTTGMDFYGQRSVTYYHYPHGSWFVPKEQRHHCPATMELPFHGFNSTCWNRWPEEWQACPPPCSSLGVEVIEHPLPAPQPLPPPGLIPQPSAPPQRPAPASSMNDIPDEVLTAGPKLAFRGKVGFSSADDAPTSVAIVDLSGTSSDKSAEQQEVLQGLKASVKPSPTLQSKGSSK
jgi:hypothetical protein